MHQVTDRQSLVGAVREYKPQVLFLDHSQKQFGPTRYICKLIRVARDTKFIVFSGLPNQNEALELILSGVKGYCSITIRTALICKAAKAVAAGEIWIGRKFLPALFEEFVRTATDSATIVQPPVLCAGAMIDFNGLSPREREITSLVASGQQNKFISNRLHISEKTVKAHLTTIFRKLGVEGRTQLAITVTGMRSQLPISNRL